MLGGQVATPGACIDLGDGRKFGRGQIERRSAQLFTGPAQTDSRGDTAF